MKWTLNLGYRKGDQVSFIGHLSHPDADELFFKFLLSPLRPTHYYEAATDTDHSIGSVDHFSIHKDGTTHTRYFSASGKPSKWTDAKLKPLIEMPEDQYLPLFVLSLYDIEAAAPFIGRPAPIEFAGFNDLDFTWNIHENNQFSLAFFLVGGNVNAAIMLETHFQEIFDLEDSTAIINCFGSQMTVVMAKDVCFHEEHPTLVIGFSRKVMPRPSPRKAMSRRSYEKSDWTLVPLGFFPTHSDDRIRTMRA